MLWAAGVQASPFSTVLAEAAGATLDRTGRVMVEPDLSVPGHPEILVIGDLAHFAHGSASPTARAWLRWRCSKGRTRRGSFRTGCGGKPRPPSGIGTTVPWPPSGATPPSPRSSASGLPGYLAWLAWLCIHLVQLVQFENRLLVFAQWAWSYVTFNRAARLITNLPAADRHGDRKGD